MDAKLSQLIQRTRLLLKQLHRLENLCYKYYTDILVCALSRMWNLHMHRLENLCYRDLFILNNGS